MKELKELKELKQEPKSYKIDPAHMQDIFYFAKEDFLRSYSYITRDDYDEMITQFFRANYTKEEVLKEFPLDKWCKAVRRAYERKKKKVLKISTITNNGLKQILDHVKTLTEYNIMDGTGYYVIAQYNDEKHTIQGDLAIDISKSKDAEKEYFTLYVDDNGLTEASWWEYTNTNSLDDLKKLIQNIIKGFIENLQKELHYEYEVFKIYPDLKIKSDKKDDLDFDIYGYTKDNQNVYICNTNDKESAQYVSNLLNDLAKAKMLVMANGKHIVRVLEK